MIATIRSWVVTAMLVATAASGCTLDPVDLEGRRCPCGAGWFCDMDAGVCRRGSGVDAGTPRDAGRDGPAVDAPREDAGPRDGGSCALDPSIGAGRIDSFRNHTCAIRNCGEMWCWGFNDFGQVGTGALTPERKFAGCMGPIEPVPVRVGTDGDWIMVSVGKEHTCGIRAGGAAYCWGHNPDGRLGTGDFADHPGPTLVSGDRELVAISAGEFHTCAIDAAGGLYCWGSNSAGELGVGVIAGRPMEEVPVRIGADVDWEQVGLGAYHSCALKGDGSLWCWGGADCGQSGTIAPLHPLAPRRVGMGRWETLHVGSVQTCVRDAEGFLACMGANGNGQLGLGFAGPPPGDAGPPPPIADPDCWPVIAEPQRIVALGPTRTASVGTSGACAVTDEGELWCWGYGRECQLGREVSPADGYDANPAAVGMAANWLQPASGFFHNCAMAENGDVLCLGSACRGKLGTDPAMQTCTPTLVTELPPRE